MDSTSQQGLSDALVQLVDADSSVLAAASTGAGGAFSFGDQYPAARYIRVAHLGYLTTFVPVAPGEEGEVIVQMLPDPVVLPPVEATASAENRWLRNVGFYDRQRTGVGTFITREEIETVHLTARRTGDILRSIPRLKIEESTYDDYVLVRSSTNILGVPCLARIYLGGVFVGRSIPRIHPSEIEAIEVYVGPSEVPIQYSGSEGACGTVLIWLRTGS